ncbi:MAG: tetratricopeptide repeat protein [Gemmataceae bacterium]|nr:tetratricopeptide repeat protein [Gemmataceae bacterium]
MNPTPGAPDAPPPAPGGLAGWLVLLPAACLLAAAGGFAGWYAGTRVAPKVGPPVAHEPEEAPAVRALTRAESARIDDLLVEGRFQEAWAHLRPIVQGRSKPAPSASYQAGLCLEGLGNPDEAMEHHRACLAKAPPHLRIAAQVGLARSALQAGKQDEGQQLLCDLLCRSGQDAFRAHPYRAEAACLLALALAGPFQDGPPPHAARPSALARASVLPAVERYVRWGEGRLPPKAPAAPARLEIAEAADDPIGFRVAVALPGTDLREALDRLSGSAGLEAIWTGGAARAVSGRRVDLACDDAPLAGLVEWLTLPHGVLAERDGKKLAFRLAAGLAPAALKAAQRERAVRVLRAALAVADGHPSVGDLFLALGNVEAVAGRWPEAAEWYERLAREHPRADAMAAAGYNLGLARLARGKLPGARQAFYGTIDRAPADPLAALCYWWVGRTHLDENDPDAALVPLRRASERDKGSSAAGAAVLGLAMRHLLMDEPGLALEALDRRQASLRKDPFHERGAFLAAFARKRLPAGDRRNSKAATAELLGAVTDKEGGWLGTAYRCLRGQALGELGLHEEMVALHDGAGPEDNPLVREMRFRSAESLLRRKAGKAARERLEKVAAMPDAWGRRAALALARLDLEEGYGERSLRRCRELLRDAREDRRAVLAALARAYAARGDYKRASEALAGPMGGPRR